MIITISDICWQFSSCIGSDCIQVVNRGLVTVKDRLFSLLYKVALLLHLIAAK